MSWVRNKNLQLNRRVKLLAVQLLNLDLRRWGVGGASVSSQPVSQPVSWRERPARSAAQSVSQDERPGELACSVSPDILIPHLLCTQSSMFCVLKIT